MPIPGDIVAGVARRLAEHAGLELPGWVVEARAAARMARLGVAPRAYVELIGSARGEGELDALVEAVRVGETRLFRHGPQIDALVSAVAPALRGRARVRAWSAGCATGEEPATLVAALAGALPGVELSVVGTDLSGEAVEVARQGSWPASALAHVPEGSRDAFASTGDGRIRLRPELARCIQIERANLLGPTPGNGFDVVWCRNVLIYFSSAARRRAVERLVSACALGGAIFVGYSETLRGIAELDAVRAGEAVYYVRRAARRERVTPVAGLQVIDEADEAAAAGGAVPPAPRVPPPARPQPPVAFAEAAAAERIALRGHPDPEELAEALGAMLASPTLRALAIELDGAELLADELAPVLRRACAALRAAGVEVTLRAARPGARRWLVRHGLEEAA